MNTDIIRGMLQFHKERRIEFFPSLPSTNTYLMQKASPDSSVLYYTTVTAGEQTAGRGRFSRSFYSPEGAGLYISVLLPCPPFCADTLPFTVIVGAAAAEAVEEASGVPVRLKWVNDLIAGGKKLGGILCESSTDSKGERYIVAGIGINVKESAFPPEIAGTAVSLERMEGYTDPGYLAGTLLNRIDIYMNEPKEKILKQYRRRMAFVGHHIAFSGAKSGEGIIAGIDDLAKLLVMTENGIVALDSGEISLNVKQS